MKLYTILLVLLMAPALCLGQKTLKATDCGIVGDGVTKNTAAIQRVIDQLSATKKGGTIVFPSGRYLSGTIEIKSNVHFVLEKGAVLLGSTDIRDYRSIEPHDAPKSNRTGDNSKLALLVCYKAENVSITGEGTIDGQGRELALNVDSVLYVTDENYRRGGGGRPQEIYRPKIINFMFLNGFEMRGITIRNSACWVQTYEICSNLLFEGVMVQSRTFWNNDGFDLTDCKNAVINNCTVDTGDDGICLKSYYNDYCCENIRVTNCRVTSSCNGLKLGTASFGGFRNIVFDNIDVVDTYLSAIAIESVDACNIDSVTISNIRAVNTMNPIFIKLGNRTNGKPGHIRDIIIDNLTATRPNGRGACIHQREFPQSNTVANYRHARTAHRACYAAQYQYYLSRQCLYGHEYGAAVACGECTRKPSWLPRIHNVRRIAFVGVLCAACAWHIFRECYGKTCRQGFPPCLCVRRCQRGENQQCNNSQRRTILLV